MEYIFRANDRAIVLAHVKTHDNPHIQSCSPINRDGGSIKCNSRNYQQRIANNKVIIIMKAKFMCVTAARDN